MTDRTDGYHRAQTAYDAMEECDAYPGPQPKCVVCDEAVHRVSEDSPSYCWDCATEAGILRITLDHDAEADCLDPADEADRETNR